MKKILALVIAALLFALNIDAQEQPSMFTNKTHTAEEQPFADLSQKIWDLMAAKDAESLKDIFHPNCEFVHMGGYWGTPQELQTIKSGGIWYKKTTVYGVDVKKINKNNWAVYSTIVLDAVVGGNTTSHPFFTTQIFTREGKKWKLASFVFTTRVFGPGIERKAPQAKPVANPSAKADMPFKFGNTLPANRFHGEAYRNDIINNDTVFNFPQTNVITFSPGSHSNWHRHGGMDILVTAGAGIYQEEGKAAQIIRKGDVVHIPAGTRHWHGAAPGSWFQQIVIYDSKWNKNSEYNDSDNIVTDNYYNTVSLSEYPHQNTKCSTMFAPGDSLIKLPAFTGLISLATTLEANNASGAPAIANVVFEPSVYNAWHEHRGGQILIATDGIGYHQIKGQPLQVMHPGDVALCPPGVRHWHGAAKGTHFAHLAISTNPEKRKVTWYKFLSKKLYDNIQKK